jgi:hypothetical protein
MVTKITISKHSVIAKKWLKPFYIHRYSSLKYLRSTNSGEPAAVVGFRNQIKVDAFLLPKSAAAGLLFFNLQLEQRVILRVETRPVFVLVRMKFENTYDIIFLFLLITALKFDRFPNSGEPAAVADLLSQSVACESALPKSAAAGLLFFNLQLEHRMMLRVGTNLVFVRIIFKNNTDIVALSIQIADLQGWQCVKIGEPAAGFGFMVQVNGGVLLLPKATAAGLLIGWSLVIGQWSVGE